MSTVKHRRAARAVVLDSFGRVLLLRGWDPNHPWSKYWFTVGGGVEDGEDLKTAVIREIAEETGLTVTTDMLIGPIAQDVAEFDFAGCHYVQHQVFFGTQVNDPVIDTAGMEKVERESTDEVRWWSIDELVATTERVYPDNLVSLMRDVLTCHLP